MPGTAAEAGRGLPRDDEAARSAAGSATAARGTRMTECETGPGNGTNTADAGSTANAGDTGDAANAGDTADSGDAGRTADPAGGTNPASTAGPADTANAGAAASTANTANTAGTAGTASAGAADTRGAAWRALGSGLDGTLLRPGDRDFTAARKLFNPRFDAVRPAAVAYCAGPGATSPSAWRSRGATGYRCRYAAGATRPRAGPAATAG